MSLHRSAPKAGMSLYPIIFSCTTPCQLDNSSSAIASKKKVWGRFVDPLQPLCSSKHKTFSSPNLSRCILVSWMKQYPTVIWILKLPCLVFCSLLRLLWWHQFFSFLHFQSSNLEHVFNRNKWASEKKGAGTKLSHRSVLSSDLESLSGRTFFFLHFIFVYKSPLFARP